jgi:hypothetical protein
MIIAPRMKPAEWKSVKRALVAFAAAALLYAVTLSLVRLSVELLFQRRRMFAQDFEHKHAGSNACEDYAKTAKDRRQTP